MNKSYSSSDEDDEAVQASAAPYVDSDDEIPPPLPPVLLHESAIDFIAFKNILSKSGLDQKRPGILINKYECLKCGHSLGEYKCDIGHRLCFRCTRFMPVPLMCMECGGVRQMVVDVSNEFEEFKAMFVAFRQHNRHGNLEQFVKDYGSEIPLDQGSFERKYLKYKQKYLALKNMRGL